MAKHDFTGCGCGLYSECQPDCVHRPGSTHDLCRRLREEAARPRLPKQEAALMREAAEALDKARHDALVAAENARNAQIDAVKRAATEGYSRGYLDGRQHGQEAPHD